MPGRASLLVGLEVAELGPQAGREGLAVGDAVLAAAGASDAAGDAVGTVEVTS